MTSAGYPAGALALLVTAGVVAWIGISLSRRLLPGWGGPPLWAGAITLACSALALAAWFLGSVGLLQVVPLIVLLLALGAGLALPVGPAEAGSDPTPLRAPPSSPRGMAVGSMVVASLVIGAFCQGTLERFRTGMTGFDSTWYHGPIAAEIARTGDTFSLHFLSPQFMTWFYPHTSELFHAVGTIAFGNDLPSILISLGCLVGCLVAAWAIGRPWGAGPLTMATVALILGAGAFADQAGEARNDLPGTLFLLLAVAILVNSERSDRVPSGPTLLIVGLAAGLAAGTKLNFLLPAIALVVGMVLLSPKGSRLRAAAWSVGGLALTGSYWYLRNLLASGNPLPWSAGSGPFGIAIPGPVQERGGRAAGSVVDYIFDPGVISDWFLPGLSEAFGQGWPIIVALAALALGFALFRPPERVLRVVAVTALVGILVWMVGPTSASGPPGEPVGFVSGLRYLVPFLAIAIALLGPVLSNRSSNVRWIVFGLVLLCLPFAMLAGEERGLTQIPGTILFGVPVLLLLVLWPWFAARPRLPLASGGLAVLLLLALGGLASGRYLDNRYSSPDFADGGLAGAMAWAQGRDGDSIAVTSTRAYPFYGQRLTNRVEYPGIRRPNGGFVRAGSCREFREVVDSGDYRYLVISLDRPGIRRDYPSEVRWVAGDPAARVVLREPPAVVFELSGPLDPSRCP